MSPSKPIVPPRCGGVFTPDPDVPADPLSTNGRTVCRCGLLGQAGDSHHPLPDVPEQAEQRGWYDHDEET